MAQVKTNCLQDIIATHQLRTMPNEALNVANQRNNVNFLRSPQLARLNQRLFL